MTTTVTATEARKNFFHLLESAEKPGMAVTITHEGHPTIIMMSFEEFEGWQETLEILSDHALMSDLREALQEMETIPLEELENAVHATDNVRSRSQKKGQKTVRKSSSKR